MLRVLMVALWVGIVIYALADWARTDAPSMPGRLPRMLWLGLIVVTIPFFAAGAFAWILMRGVAYAQERQDRPFMDSSVTRELYRRLRGNEEVKGPSSLAPDDDLEFLFRVERDIARRRAQERREQERLERLSGKEHEDVADSDDAQHNDADGNEG